MHTFRRLQIAVVLALFSMSFLGCESGLQGDGFTREPVITIRPVEGFVPAAGLPAEINYVPFSDPNNPQGNYLEGTWVASVPETQAHIKLVATNTGDVDVDVLVINFYIEDPRKVVIYKVAGWDYLGLDWFQGAPAPAMIDDTHQVFETDPYSGWMGYTPVRALKAGESVEFEVMAGGVAGFKMHLEGVAAIDEANGIWAIPAPHSGTTLVLTPAQSSARTTFDRPKTLAPTFNNVSESF